MTLIEKKIWPRYFETILKGDKTFEVRLADFAVQEGDTLVLKEWDPKTEQYTGRQIEKVVSYLLNTKNVTFWPKEQIEKNGLYVIGFK